VTDGMRSRRLLWNDPSAVLLCGLGLFVTIAIIALQMSKRADHYDPESVPIFDRLFMFQDYPASWLFLAALLLALVPAVQDAGSRLARWMGENPGAVAVVTCAVLAVGARYGYLAQPLAMDESAPYMQSRAFAAGALLGRFPPALVDWLIFPGFQGHFIQVSHRTGEFVSAYWPGFALLLAPFTAVGVPWLCNPLLGGLSVWVIHRLTLLVTGLVEAAGTAALFTVGSAAFVVNSISFYSMTAHLLCNAVYALLLLTPNPRRALLAGLVGGLALTLHNPVPHLLFATPWLIWLTLRGDRFRLGAALAAGYLPWVIIGGFGWHQLTQGLIAAAADGSVTSAVSPIAEVKDQLSAVLRLPDAQLLDARMVGLAKLWLWAAPATVLLAAVGFWLHRRDTRFQLLLASAVLTLIGFLFVPVSQGHGWGFRYFHSAWFVVPLFAAGAITAPSGRNALSRYVQGAALVGLLVMTPFFVWEVHGFIAAHLAQLPSADHGRPRVVIISPAMGYYSQDLVQNDPFLRGPVIRMVTHGRKDDAAMMARYFPDLVMLSRNYRGSVWGYPDQMPVASADVAVGRDQHR
jgi:hypothetical protein